MAAHNVLKKVLRNGFTILVRPLTTIPKVSVQLWYNVGSKDESSSEKGIAHLIEHMIFKGTKTLSESDINLITSKLSGYCNAFTSYDYTGYLFDFPSQNWHVALPIMADCMRNCTFKEDLLNSELKAVIQELKMYKDDYNSVLLEAMLNAMFPGHPYQHPIIGYKQDLWNLTRDNLVNFYKKHYIPNNATLLVVGDVDPEDVFAHAEKEFGALEPNWDYKKDTFYLNRDIAQTKTVIYRDVQQPTVIVGFTIPGAREKIDFVTDITCLLLAEGRDSRLHKKLINDLDLVTDIAAYSYDLFDQEILFVQFEPKHTENVDTIISLIHQEIDALKESIHDDELKRAVKKVEAGFLNLLESNQKQAYAIGKFYLATEDENFIFKYIERDLELVRMQVMGLAQTYLHQSCAHYGHLMPMAEQDVHLWQKLQAESDVLDQKILGRKTRELDVEPGVAVHAIEPKPYPVFNFPRPIEMHLPNGLDVYISVQQAVAKVDLILELKAKSYYDEPQKQGIGSFVSEMLLEGTKTYTAEEFARIVEAHGMDIKTSPGYIVITMLKEDLEPGLFLLTDMLTNALFETKAIERVRDRLLADIKHYWDSPSDFADQLVREEIYKNHPMSKNMLGTEESVKAITRDDLITYYKQFISPQGARLALVGDINEEELKKLLQRTVETWHGPHVPDLEYPQTTSTLVDKKHAINRDQVVLVFAGRSIARHHPDFDKLLLFDQIFGGGVLGSMSSRLFQIREQSGLFYTISGSLLANAGEQPGMFVVKTIVSLDRLAEAEDLIKKTILNAAYDITDEELSQAKNALINARVDNFSTYKQIASSFLFLKKYNLPADFFDKRAEQLLTITKEEIQDAVKKIVTSPMFLLKVGRV